MGPENSDGLEGLARLRGLFYRHFYGGLEGFHWESGQGIGRPGERAWGKEKWGGRKEKRGRRRDKTGGEGEAYPCLSIPPSLYTNVICKIWKICVENLELAAKTLYHNRGGGHPFSRPSSPFSHPFSHFSHLTPFPLFSPPLFSFLSDSLYTVRHLITDAQTGQKKTIYKYIPQLRS